MRVPVLSSIFTLFIALFATLAHASCGAAYCLVNTQDTMAVIGSQLDVRYEYIRQNQLMADDSKAVPAGVIDEHDESETYNRNWQFGYAYVDVEGWGVSVNVPVVARDHYHVHNDIGGPEPESWHFTGLGDIRVQGQFKLSARDDHSSGYGVIGGLKFPTGRFHIENNDGELAERTLQPGTGTTDVIIGGYYHQVIAGTRSSIFAKALAQSAVDSRDHFKPGEQLGIDAGYRYSATERLGLNLQANYLIKWRDQGAEAEPGESGLRALFISPGISYGLTPRVQIYSYVQLPVYQNVNGTQLTADYALTAGVNTRF